MVKCISVYEVELLLVRIGLLCLLYLKIVLEPEHGHNQLITLPVIDVMSLLAIQMNKHRLYLY